MTIIEQKAEALIQRALIVLEGVSSEGPVPVAADIRAFLAQNGGQLPQHLKDDLTGALARLEGRGTGAPQAERSVWVAGLKTWVNDDSSFREYWGGQIKETAARLGAFLGETVAKTADESTKNALKSPVVLAAAAVVAVLGAAWVYRSFK